MAQQLCEHSGRRESCLDEVMQAVGAVGAAPHPMELHNLAMNDRTAFPVAVPPFPACAPHPTPMPSHPTHLAQRAAPAVTSWRAQGRARAPRAPRLPIQQPRPQPRPRRPAAARLRRADAAGRGLRLAA